MRLAGSQRPGCIGLGVHVYSSLGYSGWLSKESAVPTSVTRGVRLYFPQVAGKSIPILTLTGFFCRVII